MQEQEELFNENDFNISVTQAKYISNEITDCDELFSNFDELRVVTYSYGLKFVEQIIPSFSYVELIVGNDKLIEKNLAEVMMNQEYNFDFAKIIFNQTYVCSYIKDNNYLLQRVHEGSFRVFVPEDLLSHQKIYLLKSKDNRYRTIVGSANFSYAAWKNQQLEEFVCFDEKEAYDYFLEKYNILNELSTDEISISAFEAKTDEESVEELPVFKKIQTNDSIVIKSDTLEECDTVLKTNNLNEQIFDTLKSVKLTTDKQGNTLVETKDVRVILSELKQVKEKKKEQEAAYPQLVLDYENENMYFKNRLFDLAPPKEDVSKNIMDILAYFSSFDSCIEDSENSMDELRTLKRTYWKILNYMFLSPFLAYFRNFANKYDFDETIYPIYLIITGDSGIGKTSFVQSVQKLMLNCIPQKYFARNLKKEEFDGFKVYAKGVPLLIDEMDNDRWGKLKNTVKADDFLFEKSYLNHPCFIMPSNNITYLESEIQRRCIHFKIDVRLDETKTAYKNREIKHFQKEFTNAFYCEYVHKMFLYLKNILKEMKLKDATEHWIPDIYKGSSDILHSIISDYNIEIPEEFDNFDLNDYKGNSEKLENAKRILIETYRANSEIFEVLKGQNILQIDFTSYSNDVRNKKNINILARDLPRYFSCKQYGLKLEMNLNEFTKLTGIKIKRGFFR